jgi:hypothetical protein
MATFRVDHFTHRGGYDRAHTIEAATTAEAVREARGQLDLYAHIARFQVRRYDERGDLGPVVARVARS